MKNKDIKGIRHWQLKKHSNTRQDEFVVDLSDAINKKEKEGYFIARVLEVHKNFLFVATQHDLSLKSLNTKDIWLATVARKYLQIKRKQRNFVAVGDIVLCKISTTEDRSKDNLPSCVIEFKIARQSKITRLDPLDNKREHVIAANVTKLVIVCSVKRPDLKWGLIDRFLVLAEDQGVEVEIILNKKDLLLAGDELSDTVIERCSTYREMGYSVNLISATQNEASELAPLFKDHISVIVGNSGVGKSTIVNCLNPEIVQEVELKKILSKGRHKTTYASFIMLGTGGHVIDTPGVRSFNMENFDILRLGWCFRDMRQFIGNCKFRKCRHIEEPECAIRAAVKTGEISGWRYDSYITILTKVSKREGRFSIE